MIVSDAERKCAGPSESELELTVIVPARNEEVSLAECLQSLVAQSEPGFALGARVGADRGG